MANVKTYSVKTDGNIRMHAQSSMRIAVETFSTSLRLVSTALLATNLWPLMAVMTPIPLVL